MAKQTKKQHQFLTLVAEELGDVDCVTRKQVQDLVKKHEATLKWPSWLTGDKQYRKARGVFSLPKISEEEETNPQSGQVTEQPAE